jgi:hypothetical protein
MSSPVNAQLPLSVTCANFEFCHADEDSSKIPDVSIVEASAELLYGLVHQRYILTRAGLQAMVCLLSRPSLKKVDVQLTRIGS